MAPADPAFAGEIEVEVVYCPAPHRIDRCRVVLPAGSPVQAALEASGVLQRHGLVAGELRLGVWGRACDAAHPLRERDRVEIYRPLQVDPKEARRLRYKGKRAAPGTATATGTDTATGNRTR